MFISIYARKAFDKIEYPFMIKIFIKVGVGGRYNNIIKVIYDKPTSNIILQDEKVKEVFPLKSELKQGYTFSPILYSIVLEVLNSSPTRKIIKTMKIGREEVKLLLFAFDMIYLEKSLKSPPKNYYT